MAFTLTNAGPVSITLPDMKYLSLNAHHQAEQFVRAKLQCPNGCVINGVPISELLVQYHEQLIAEIEALREQYAQWVITHTHTPLVMQNSGRKYREDDLGKI